jgi:hypothetical protein
MGADPCQLSPPPAALGRALDFDITDSVDSAVSALEVAAASREAVALEDAVVAAGGCGAALRSAADWAAHPVGRAASAGQLVGWDEALRMCSTVGLRSSASAARPCTGLRVLDLTRVIGGPVAGRTLAALGAEASGSIHRISPSSRFSTWTPDRASGSPSSISPPRREALLAGADVVLIGYRPGALDRFGLRADELAERHRHLVQVHLSAWGTTGRWARRRGVRLARAGRVGHRMECAGRRRARCAPSTGA